MNQGHEPGQDTDKSVVWCLLSLVVLMAVVGWLVLTTDWGGI